MIKIGSTEVFGFEAAIRGARNPLNSWDKSDSTPGYSDNGADVIIGEKDFGLLRRLRNAGTDHRKYMRMLTVYCDIIAPLYWWKEFDTYKVGTVANSCSTMHKIHAKELDLDDFSHEHLGTWGLSMLGKTIAFLNCKRESFIGTENKDDWWEMIQMLPTSYNQKRTVMLNYEVLTNIYKSRRNHKLDEWHDFCAWIESLPYSELITGKECVANE